MPADALAATAGQPKLEAKEKSRKAILDADAIACPRRILQGDHRHCRVESFNSQGFEKVAKSLVLKPDDKRYKLALKKSGGAQSQAASRRRSSSARRGEEGDLRPRAQLTPWTCRNSILTIRQCHTITLEEEQRRANQRACCPSRTTSTRPRTTRARPEGALRSKTRAMAENSGGTAIDAGRTHLNDGFSPGQATWSRCRA